LDRRRTVESKYHAIDSLCRNVLATADTDTGDTSAGDTSAGDTSAGDTSKDEHSNSYFAVFAIIVPGICGIIIFVYPFYECVRRVCRKRVGGEGQGKNSPLLQLA